MLSLFYLFLNTLQPRSGNDLLLSLRQLNPTEGEAPEQPDHLDPLGSHHAFCAIVAAISGQNYQGKYKRRQEQKTGGTNGGTQQDKVLSTHNNLHAIQKNKPQKTVKKYFYS
jgi:hypothetical protein